MTHSSPANAELLPCPFCGNQPSLKIMGDGVSIRCKTFFCPLEDIEIPDDTLDEAKKRWNKRSVIRAQCAPDRDMLAALKNVQRIIAEAAMTGFNFADGDWPERLFHSQQMTSAAIKKATASSSPGCKS